MITHGASHPTIYQLYYSECMPERGTLVIVRPSPPPRCIPTCLSIPVQMLEPNQEEELVKSVSKEEPFSLIMNSSPLGRRRIVFPIICTEEEKSLFETIRQKIEGGAALDIYSREKVARILLASGDIMKAIQQFAVTTPPGEVRAIIDRNWQPFVDSMRSASRARHRTFMRTIKSCTTSQGKRARFVAIQSACGLTGFYEKDTRIIGEGTVCQVSRLTPLSPSTNPRLAVAKVKKEFIRQHPHNHVALHPDEYLNKECAASQFLRDHGVPYILNMWYETKLSFHDAFAPRVLMEYCGGGTLLCYARQEHPLLERMTHGLRLAQALHGMHALGAYHLDLKPDNILLTTGEKGEEIRIADFGSCVLTKGLSYEINRGPSYPAPELFHAFRAQRSVLITEKLDAWNFGDLLHCLKYGTSLLCDLCLGWDSEKYETGLEELERRRVPLLQSEDPIDRAIALLLSKQAEDRPSASAVVQVIQQWLTVTKS